MISHLIFPIADSLGRKQDTFCVDVDHIGEWIFGINPKKVKPEIQERKNNWYKYYRVENYISTLNPRLST